GRDDEQVVVSQYDMNCLEKAGMLKMDFLGLTTLTVIHDALVMIEERRGQKIDLDTLPLEDPEVYRMLRAGRTVGVFQFESPLATDMLRGMRCDRFDDLVASNALMRPGPLDAGMHRVYQRRKKGEEAVSYALPELEAILKPTYGVITYQEQVMRIAQQLAGISLAEADVLRKAVGKKDAELIRKELDKFISKSVARGYDPKVVHELSAQIETFGRYGFNKSHSVAYSVISYHTAWLKAHYAPEFMAALLSSSIGDTDNVVKYIAEARELGLEVLAPDVNESGYKFTVVGDKRLRFGLGAIRNVGHSAIDSILAARQERQFTDLFDLCERVDLRVCNRRVFEALIASGALDSLGTDRARCWAALDAALGEASLKQAEKESGQVSLFGDMFGDAAPAAGGAENITAGSAGVAEHRFPNVPAWSESERLSKEKEILGFYISGHPLEPYQMECELFASHTVSQLGAWSPDPIKLGVVITAIKRQISKRSGSEFARLTVEDFTGSAEVLIFPEKWSTIADRVKTDIPVLLGGGYSKRDRDADAPTFIVETVTPFAEMAFSGQVGVAITLGHTEDVTDDVLRDVRAVIEAHSNGSTAAPALEVRWKDGNGGARLRSRSLRLPASHAALTELRALLGPERVHLVRAGQGA
ncbi:MAG TPA: DNA polymerase III subunit alpha, partial [Gemmatimonadaceae bacterium]|nr:DNA polymerase III subunit alpha [Gemmatimonadaceae bacterium]